MVLSGPLNRHTQPFIADYSHEKTNKSGLPSELNVHAKQWHSGQGLLGPYLDLAWFVLGLVSVTIAVGSVAIYLFAWQHICAVQRTLCLARLNLNTK